MNKNISITDKKLNTAAYRILESLGVVKKQYNSPEYRHRNHATHLLIDLAKLGQVTDEDMLAERGRGPKAVERARLIIDVINSSVILNINWFKHK